MQSNLYDWLKMGSTSIPNVLFKRYSDLKLTADEFVLITYLLSQLSSQPIDEMDAISKDLGWDTMTIMEHMNQLMMKEYLAIELMTNPDGTKSDHFTLRPLFEQLDKQLSSAKVAQNRPQLAKPSGESAQLIATFEREFGRVLTPIELETINQWLVLDSYQPDLIRLALKEAVIHQAISLKYIDKILLSWEKKNIRTVQEAQQELRRFQGRQEQAAQNAHYDDIEIPIVEWKPNKLQGE
ncbi:MAG: DnaD domain protein [Aerococcaceae bacterium]|nr:DnaD domain protein [Aerococcaceae bacterium]